jgi:hypothetical protein
MKAWGVASFITVIFLVKKIFSLLVGLRFFGQSTLNYGLVSSEEEKISLRFSKSMESGRNTRV